MQALAKFSDIIIPVIIFYVVGYGFVSKVKVYESFLKGAGEGIETAVRMMPTLIGLLVGVGVLRASGFLDMLGGLLANLVGAFGVPSEIVPLFLVKMFSGSAATGLVLDIFRTYGPDSYVGIMASLLMSCTETCFYTMSVYYLAAKITKTRYTLPGALFAICAGFVASVVLTGMLFG